jgi:hypothetical protein
MAVPILMRATDQICNHFCQEVPMQAKGDRSGVGLEELLIKQNHFERRTDKAFLSMAGRS